MSTDEKWRLVADKPELWWDNRDKKPSSRSPDFKLKSQDRNVNVALWLSGRDTPAWAKDDLSLD